MSMNLGRIFFICLLGGLLVGCSDEPEEIPTETVSDKIITGFFSPDYVDRYVPFVQHSILNVYPMLSDNGQLQVDLGRLEMMFNYVKPFNHRISLDLGSVITNTVAPRDLNRRYIRQNGQYAQKVFEAMPKNKLKKLVSNDELLKRLDGLPELINKYRNNVGLIFLVDEPYLNGVSPAELDRVIAQLRTFFSDHGVNDLQYGAIFASAMFNKDFAALINRKMMDYVEQTDNYFHQHKHLLTATTPEAEAFHDWLTAMEDARLVTYDRAGNLYLGGGLPKQIDLVSFDFYISTTLLDSIHTDTLDYLHDIGMEECQPFASVTIPEIRQMLTFIEDGPFVESPAARRADQKLLDDIFACRMGATKKLLAAEIEARERPLRAFMIAESSANGLAEFDSQGKLERDQPEAVIEQRILDEVRRSYRFYLANREFFDAGLVFFLYPNTYDVSINLRVLGAQGAESVLDYIYSISYPATNDMQAARNVMDFAVWEKHYRQN